MSGDINVQTFSGKVNINNNLKVGSGHLFVDTLNNQVGLNTNDPQANLHVNGNTYVHTNFRVGSGIVMNETPGQITAGSFVGDGSGITSVNSDSGSWVNGTSSNVHLATTGDSVGIGTVSPDAKLHLYQSAGSTNLVEKHTNASTGEYQQHVNYTHYASVAGGPSRDPDNSRGLWIGNMVDENDNSPSGANFVAFTDSFQFYGVADRTKYDDALSFASNTDTLKYADGNFVKVMRINADGNVGIGVTTVDSGIKLQVNGVVKATGFTGIQESDVPTLSAYATTSALSTGLATKAALAGSTTQNFSAERVGMGATASASYKLYVKHDDTTATGGTTAAFIDANYSGSDTFTGDKTNHGLFIDVDSSATGGGTSHEHRLYGVYADVRHTGDSDLCYAGYFYARSDHTAGQCSTLRGIYASAQDSAIGTNSGVYAGEFKALKDSGSTNTTATMMGIRAEVEIDAGIITNAYGVHSHIDRDGGTITNGYLFHGTYAGSDTGVKWGIHLSGAEKNYLTGTLEVVGFVKAGYNTNTTSYFGRSAVGYVGHSDWAGFAHLDRNNTSDYALIQNSSGQTIINCNTSQSIQFASGNSTKMRMLANGNFGVGTTSPSYKLQVNGLIYGSGGCRIYGEERYTNYTNSESDYLTNGGNVQVDPPSLSFGLYVDRSINAAGIVVFSDQRIKSNVVDINDTTALDQVRLLKPKYYGYVDKIKKGSSSVIGFIAQEVKEVIPRAVYVGDGEIPNIYEMATISSNNTVTFTDFNTSNLEGTNCTLIAYLAEDERKEVTITEVVDEHTVRVEEDMCEWGAELFVWGQKVQDFHHLNKDYIWTVATAALQEVDRQLQAEKEKTQQLEVRLSLLESTLASLIS